MLLLLDDEGGQFAQVPPRALGYALAGSVLMDLALENRIDTDLECLILVDATPTGDDLLDPTLAQIAAGERRDARFWVERTAERAEAIREATLARVVARHIVDRRAEGFHWVFRFDWSTRSWGRPRRYPAIDGEALQEVKQRITAVLLHDELPHPRDVVIICLASACGILEALLSREEFAQAAPRIEQVRKLDLIGQAMTQAIRDIETSVATSMDERR